MKKPQLPKKLYHATDVKNAESIAKYGLDPSRGSRRYSISRKTVCLASSSFAAEDFLLDGSDSKSGKSLDPNDIIIYEIDTKDLDLNKLFLDPNKRASYDMDSKSPVWYMEYTDVIPPSKLKVVKSKVEDFDFEFDPDVLSVKL